jgi:tetratricopeptide (TPR) repeat protein
LQNAIWDSDRIDRLTADYKLLTILFYIGGFFKTEEDANKAVSAAEERVQRTPKDHARFIRNLSFLASALSQRFFQLWRADDLEKAISIRRQIIQTISNNREDNGLPINMQIQDLGRLLEHRFKRLGEITDINEAVYAWQKSLDLTPSNHADRYPALIGLGATLTHRFGQLGDVADIDKAISAQRQALELVSDDDSKKAVVLMSLGTSLKARFQQLGEISDIDKAILAHQQALEIMPNNHAEKSLAFQRLGNSLARRFQQSREITDVDQAISAHERALFLTPEGHHERFGRLNNLGNSFRIRFQQLGEITDIDKAILALQQALELIPDGHTEKPVILVNLSHSWAIRFIQSALIADINKATSIGQQALDLMPDDDRADKSDFLWNLGFTYTLRYAILQKRDDFTSAASAFKQASYSPIGRPLIRFMAARFWSALYAHSQSESDTPCLEAYSVMIFLIPRLIWLGNSVPQRFNETRSVSKAVAEAVKFACTRGRLDLALEWLEQGRSIVWSQILHLRTPTESLSYEHPDLHRILHDITQQLGHCDSGYPHVLQMKSDTVITEGMWQELLSTEEAGQRRRRLAENWEALLAEVRSHPGYEDFLQPRKFSSLTPASKHSTIVLISVHEDCCDALILRQASSTVENLHLASVSEKRIDAIHALFLTLLGSRSNRIGNHMDDVDHVTNVDIGAIYSSLLPDLDSTRATRPYYGPRHLDIVFEFLWNKIVKPILDFLNFSVRHFLFYFTSYTIVPN